MADRFVPTANDARSIIKHYLTHLVARKTLVRFADSNIISDDEKSVMVNNRVFAQEK